MDRYIEFATNHWMLFIALVVVSFFLIQELLGSLWQKFESISPILAVTQMNTEDTVVVDVSDPHEYAKGHIKDSINLPFGKFDDSIGGLDKYKDTPMIVTCQTGTRSTPACKKLTKSGFNKIFNLTGGMQSWEENKLPLKKSGKK